MGADFKEKTRKSFKKCWDKAAVKANTPDLFFRAADHAPSRYEAEAIDGSSVIVGESFCVRLEDGEVIGRRGLTPVITIAMPTPGLVQSITEGCNVARADVVAIDPISGVLEVTIH